MSLVQKLISEKYDMPYPRKVESFDSIGANDFLFALEVSSDTSLNDSCNEERKSSQHSYKCPIRKYSNDIVDEWFKEEYNSILFLSLEDIDNVRKKWRKIKNDPTTFGTLIAITLLNDAPETAAKMGLNPGVLYNGVIVYDVVTVQIAKEKAELLNKIIKYIHLPECVSAIAHERGVQLSFRKRKLDKKDFQALHSAIMKTVTTHYKMDNTPEIIASIKKTLWIAIGLVEDASHWNDFSDRG